MKCLQSKKQQQMELVWKFSYVSKCVGSLLIILVAHKNVMVEREGDILVTVFHEKKAANI